MLLIFILVISFMFISPLYPQQRKKVFVGPFSNETQITTYDFLSSSFQNGILSELRDVSDVKILNEFDPLQHEIQGDAIITGSFMLIGDKILVSINLLGSPKYGGIPITKKINIIDSIKILSRKDLLYELKHHVSKISKFYILGLKEMKKDFIPLSLGSPPKEKITVKYEPEYQAKELKSIKIASEYFNKALESKTLEEEIMNYSRSIFFYPEFYQSWYNLGVIYYNLGKKGKAIYFFTKFLEKCPKEKEDLISRVREIVIELLGEAKDMVSRETAMDYLMKAISLSDFSDEELKYLFTSIQIDPDFWPAMRRAGEIYYSRGMFLRSIELLERYLKKTTEDDEIKERMNFIVGYLKEIYRK